MMHATRASFGKHPGFFNHPHSDGSKRIGLALLAALAAGGVLVTVLLVRALLPANSETRPALVASGPAAVSKTDATIPGPSAITPPQAIEGPIHSAIKPPTDIVVPAPATSSAPVVPGDSAAPHAAPAPPAAVTPVQVIRDVDFRTLPALQALSGQLGGRVYPASIIYADLTGDGVEEAIVPITSDGTLGTLGFVVYTEHAGTPEPILVRIAGKDRSGPSVILDRGQLTETNAVYGPTDPNCCPSQLVKTYYRWDGHSLIFDRTETITVPQGKYSD